MLFVTRHAPLGRVKAPPSAHSPTASPSLQSERHNEQRPQPAKLEALGAWYNSMTIGLSMTLHRLNVKHRVAAVLQKGNEHGHDAST
jgi:hypothetical protein